jgi:RHS repeat-associated protein
MALSAHKTAPQNSTQTMRFYPFVFLPERMRTACDRSGANGNGASSRGTRRTDNARGQLETSRRLCWTEDVAAQSERRASLLAFPSQSCVGAANRLQAFMERGNEGGIAAWYNYSADGERNIKLTSPRLNIQQNASMFSNPPLVYPTLYASSLVTLTKQGYTKHYFEEGRRICSKIGGGMRGNVTVQEIDNRVGELASSYDEQYHSQNDGIRQTFHDCIGADPQIIDGVNLHQMLVDREVRRDEEEPAFFYHSDHLGSAAYLTYHGGVIQTLNYLPYGEDWVERNYFAPHDTTRLGIYRFNGKEKDYESGFHYYGARYYWSEVLTGWLSVDPMADKYPNISPYNYCMWNPVTVIDPNGMDTVISYTPTDNNNKTVRYDRRHYSYSRPDILHYCSHGASDCLFPYGCEEYPKETAIFIENQMRLRGINYEIIVFHSCDVGGGEGCFAEQLSSLLPNTLIFAPSDKLAISDVCDAEFVKNNGFWNVYYGGVLVSSCYGSNDDTKALQIIWKYMPTQTIKDVFLKQYYNIVSPIVIESNFINEHLEINDRP